MKKKPGIATLRRRMNRKGLFRGKKLFLQRTAFPEGNKKGKRKKRGLVIMIFHRSGQWWFSKKKKGKIATRSENSQSKHV